MAFLSSCKEFTTFRINLVTLVNSLSLISPILLVLPHLYFVPMMRELNILLVFTNCWSSLDDKIWRCLEDFSKLFVIQTKTDNWHLSFICFIWHVMTTFRIVKILKITPSIFLLNSGRDEVAPLFTWLKKSVVSQQRVLKLLYVGLTPKIRSHIEKSPGYLKKS